MPISLAKESTMVWHCSGLERQFLLLKTRTLLLVVTPDVTHWCLISKEWGNNPIHSCHNNYDPIQSSQPPATPIPSPFQGTVTKVPFSCAWISHPGRTNFRSFSAPDGDFRHGGPPKWMMCKGKSYSLMDDLGVPPIYGNGSISDLNHVARSHQLWWNLVATCCNIIWKKRSFWDDSTGRNCPLLGLVAQ